MTQTNRQALIDQILTANHAYAKGLPLITDSEYDLLWKELHQLDPDCPILYHTGENSNLPFGKRTHRHPIYGTQKAFDIDSLKPFVSRFGSDELILEPKYDGCAAVFYLGQDNLSSTLILEGDGQTGADVSHHLPAIQMNFVPTNMESVELVIPNASWDKAYGANPRNVVAGWIARQTLPHDQLIEMISHNNPRLSQLYSFSGDFDSLYELLLSLYIEWSSLYPLDGIMIKVADEKKRIITNHNGSAYAWSIAWKPPIETADTICQSIEWNVSRHGRVIPTVIYDPIELCQTMNSRVTGNNAKWILENQIRPGSKLTIGKAGSIIPKIVGVEND